MQQVCLIHYHEIGLKGKNRSRFENRLLYNLRTSLENMPVSSIRRISGHLLCEVSEQDKVDDIAKRIMQTPGVARVSCAYKCKREEEQYFQAALLALHGAGDFNSFKVHAHKSNTDFEKHTIDINREVGAVLCAEFPDKKVDLHNPDVCVNVLISQGDVFVWATSYKGVGGLPVGSAGKVVTLLSNGFDSPVATWQVGRRGATCIPIHFSGRPQTADTSEYLVQDIVEALEPSGVCGRLYVVPFGDCQREISLKAPQNMRILMYRRVMFQVAEKIAELEGAKALVTGESLGQVASQTLENIQATNEAVSLPIFRPLIGSDKVEIIERAQMLHTYDISAQSAPDCCTLFMPRQPETHARMEDVHAAWESFDHEAMVEELMEKIEYRDFSNCPSYKPPKQLKKWHDELLPAYDKNM